MPPKKGGKKRQKTDRPTSDEEIEVSYNAQLKKIDDIWCHIENTFTEIIFHFYLKAKKKKSAEKEDGDDDDDDDKSAVDKDEAKGKQSKFPERYVEPGLWRIKDAKFRVSTPQLRKFYNIVRRDQVYTPLLRKF